MQLTHLSNLASAVALKIHPIASHLTSVPDFDNCKVDTEDDTFT
jgi:hypothetical protein